MSRERVTREFPDRPWVGVGVVIWHEGKVLLVQRGKPPKYGEWGIPGGAQKLGETVFQTAIREVFEETTITIEPVTVLTVIDAITSIQNRIQYHYTLVEILGAYRSGNPSPRADILQTRWSTWKDVDTLVGWEKTKDIIRLGENFKH